jgi:hypothetical protein
MAYRGGTEVQPSKQAQQHAASPEMGTAGTTFESQEANNYFAMN